MCALEMLSYSYVEMRLEDWNQVRGPVAMFL